MLRHGGFAKVTCAETATLHHPQVNSPAKQPLTPQEVQELSNTYGFPIEVNTKYFKIPDGEYGQYYIKTNTKKKHQIKTGFFKAAKAKIVPWNFWYFPYNENISGRHLFDPDGPLAKYDAFVKRKFPDAPESLALKWEKDNHKKQKGTWQGHCAGAAHASILFAQPEPPADNQERFVTDDIEGLLAELCNTVPFIKRTCTVGPNTFRYALEKDDMIYKPQPFCHTENKKDPSDPWVDDFHMVLTEWIKQTKQPLTANLRVRTGNQKRGTEVWNHAVYKYIATYEEAPGTNDNTQVQITNAFTANEDILLPLVNGQRTKDGISVGNPETGVKREQTAIYVLKYDAAHGIVQRDVECIQNWISLTNNISQEDVFPGVKKGVYNVYIPQYLISPVFPEKRGLDWKGIPPHGNPFINEAYLKVLGIKENKY